MRSHKTKIVRLTKAVLIASAAVLIGWGAHAQSPDTPKLPDGEGKDLVQRICTDCHGLDTAIDQGRTEAEWKSVIDTMVSRGADATDAQETVMVKYLAKNFGKAAK